MNRVLTIESCFDDLSESMVLYGAKIAAGQLRNGVAV